MRRTCASCPRHDDCLTTLDAVAGAGRVYQQSVTEVEADVAGVDGGAV